MLPDIRSLTTRNFTARSSCLSKKPGKHRAELTLGILARLRRQTAVQNIPFFTLVAQSHTSPVTMAGSEKPQTGA